MRGVWLAGLAALVPSCALVLDFDSGRSTSSSGATASTASTASTSTSTSSTGTGGGGAPTTGWVSMLSAEPQDAAVRVMDIAVSGDTTIVAGYFIGTSLLVGDGTSSDTPILSATGGVTTFVLTLDAAGTLIQAIPIATSTFDETPSDDWLGAHVALDGAGGFFLISSARRGVISLTNPPTNTDLDGWNLVMARFDSTGTATWASRCSGVAGIDDATYGTNVSARRAGIAPIGTAVLVGATLQELGAVSCTTLVGPSGAGECALKGAPEAQSGVIWSLDPATGACSPDTLSVESSEITAAIPMPLWLDGLAPDASGGVAVAGRVAQGAVTLQPWGTDVGGRPAFAFTALVGADGSAPTESVSTFESDYNRWIPAGDDVFGGSVKNTAGAQDLRMFRQGQPPLAFGNDSDAAHDEVALGVSSRAGAVLVTGFLTENGSLSTDLCGAACAGDLASSDPQCNVSPVGSRDAFWVLLDDTTAAPLPAVGRSLGGCGDQVVMDGELSDSWVTLAVEMRGSATIDFLDGAHRTFGIAAPRLATLIARIPRPAPATP